MKAFPIIILLAAYLVTLVQPSFAQDQEFPGRTTYPDVPFYTTDQLSKEYDDVIIVDVRSVYEFETLHIRDALNIPINDKDYAKQLIAARGSEKQRPIVVYCNGFTCLKSYKAVLKARHAGVDNVYTYDAGVFEWTKTFPERATLLGETPVNPDRLLSKQNLKEHMLKPDAFMSKSVSDALILDIREPYQHGMLEIFPLRQKNIALSKKERLTGFLNKLKGSDQLLLVYDATGRQVRWLQYYLEANNIKNYYFMEGGVAAYFDHLRVQLNK